MNELLLINFRTLFFPVKNVGLELVMNVSENLSLLQTFLNNLAILNLFPLRSNSESVTERNGGYYRIRRKYDCRQLLQTAITTHKIEFPPFPAK